MLAGLLAPLSWLYSAGLGVYLSPYRFGIRRRYKLPCRVVSVGNLTFGGTGKSPTVRAICQALVEHGIRPAVLSRGHGGRLCRVGAIVSDGRGRTVDAVDCGDEPAALADALPGVPVAIGKDRRVSGRRVVEAFDPDLIVLDDGMQYWQLHRDVEIVLMSALAPFDTGMTLPAGDLREPARGVKRADVVIVTGVEAAGEEHSMRFADELSSKAPRAEVFLAKRVASAIVDTSTGERMPLECIEGVSVVGVSGIANPQSFESMLISLGADVKEFVRFGDHCAYSIVEVDSVEKALARTGAAAVVTTAKDAVKLKLKAKTYVLDMDMQVENMDRLLELVAGTELWRRVGTER